VLLRFPAFWSVTPCRTVSGSRRFEWSHCLLLGLLNPWGWKQYGPSEPPRTIDLVNNWSSYPRIWRHVDFYVGTSVSEELSTSIFRVSHRISHHCENIISHELLFLCAVFKSGLFNPLKTKSNLHYMYRSSPYRAVNTLSRLYKPARQCCIGK
jgi:hypothetical protein